VRCHKNSWIYLTSIYLLLVTFETNNNYLIRFKISNNSSTIRFDSKWTNTIRIALSTITYHILNCRYSNESCHGDKRNNVTMRTLTGQWYEEKTDKQNGLNCRVFSHREKRTFITEEIPTRLQLLQNFSPRTLLRRDWQGCPTEVSVALHSTNI